MNINNEIIDDIVVIRLNGRLDAYTSLDLENAINETIENGNRKIIINFKEIDYISSSGLRVILATLKQMNKQDGKLKLACLRTIVKEVFDIAGFTQLFEIYDTEDEALKSF